eukprot:16348019-Heterocapsa_arctica.AAC.1
MSETIRTPPSARRRAQQAPEHCPAGQYAPSLQCTQAAQMNWSFFLWESLRTTWSWLQTVHLSNLSDVAC